MTSTPPTSATSAKTDYVYEILQNYELLYLTADRLARQCIKRKYSPRQSGRLFQVNFSDLAHALDYRSQTRGTPGRLDWSWIATAFIAAITDAESTRTKE